MKEYIDISRIDDWNELQRANVIEKEKIDKAIEEKC